MSGNSECYALQLGILHLSDDKAAEDFVDGPSPSPPQPSSLASVGKEEGFRSKYRGLMTPLTKGWLMADGFIFVYFHYFCHFLWDDDPH